MIATMLDTNSGQSPYAPPSVFSTEEILKSTAGHLVQGPEQGSWTVTTDSRLAEVNRIFFALQGDRFDGHQFVPQVLSNAGFGAIVARDRVEQIQEGTANGTLLIAVDDPLVALQDLAKFERSRFDGPVVAVTGSAGKTTTKEMIASILGLQQPGYATQGNLNNHIGVPLTLLHRHADHRWLVLEMGMSNAGEIARLADLGAPTHRVVTSIAPAHLDTLGTIEGVAAAKSELFASSRDQDIQFVPTDGEAGKLLTPSKKSRIVRFGFSKGADYRVSSTESNDSGGQRVKVESAAQSWSFGLALRGAHQAANASAAIAVTHELGCDVETIVEGLERMIPARGRGAEVEINGITIIDDTYNANPASVRAALAQLVHDAQGHTVAILGDMLELGEKSTQFHGEVGRMLVEFGVHQFVGVGAQMKSALEEARRAGHKNCQVVGQATDAADLVVNDVHPGDRILVKGSRGMRMERAVSALERGLS